ncbi:MAG: hypothetical protein QG620_651 [Patescibacteria group bacterium]|nr:hypothetical protein [Patescibacteria group bacterium]
MTDWELKHGRIGASELEEAESAGEIYPVMWLLFFLAGLFIFCVLVSPKFKAEGVLEEVCAIAFNCMAPFVLFLAACIGLSGILIHIAFFLLLRHIVSSKVDIAIVVCVIIASEAYFFYQLFFS